MAETRTRAALEACGTYINRNKFALAGHSMGGIMSLEIADRRPWWLPVPKAVVLHDPAGYEFTPLLATDPFTVAEEGFVTTDYDRFRNLSSQTQLVALVAKDTWYDSFAGVTSELGFGNGNAGGILSRAWHNTPSTVRKKFLIVWENLSLGRSNHGAAVRNPFYQAVYWRHTRDALSAAFGGRTYVPNLTADPTGINAYLFSGMPAPLPFAWNCASGLPEGIAELLDDREFLELANEFGETGNLMLGLQLLDMLWDADPEFAMALMMAGTDGGATLGDLLGGTVTNYHPRDALLGSRLACFLTPLADRNWDWLYAVIESEVFLAELPCD
jgi:pimeloyl-ACP methyl ester carboxylesterase